MSNIAHSATHVYRQVGLHYLLTYALAHPHACGQWVDALTRLLAKGVR